MHPCAFGTPVEAVPRTGQARLRRRATQAAPHHALGYRENAVSRARVDAVHAGETAERRKHAHRSLRQLAAVVAQPEARQPQSFEGAALMLMHGCQCPAST